MEIIPFYRASQDQGVHRSGDNIISKMWDRVLTSYDFPAPVAIFAPATSLIVLEMPKGLNICFVKRR